jgi:hypothetical protein
MLLSQSSSWSKITNRADFWQGVVPKKVFFPEKMAFFRKKKEERLLVKGAALVWSQQREV